MSLDRTLTQSSETVRSLPKLSENATVHYTAHHNWAWVLAEAIRHISIEQSDGTPVPTYLCSRCKELPSQRDPHDKKTKIKYALFRLEIERTSLKNLSVAQTSLSTTVSVWATSPAFAFLDPKDALYRELQLRKCGHLMPKTTLLNWDLTDTCDIGDLPSVPALLKASLGSGGFGLYFVYDKNDVLSIIKAHADRARTFAGFLDSLRRDHNGNIPCWSLQSLLKSYRVIGEYSVSQEDQLSSSHNTVKDALKHPSRSSTKRCQIRVYIVSCGLHLYMYDTYEARLPSWNIDLEGVLTAASSAQGVSLNTTTTTTTSQSNERMTQEIISDTQESVDSLGDIAEETMTVDEFETYCCSGGNARPYNQDRNKSITERFIFEELPDLEFARETVGNCVRDAMNALKIPILHQMNANSQVANPAEVGLIHGSDSGRLQNFLTSIEKSALSDKLQNGCTSNLNDKSPTEMAICGIDLMLEIVENDFIGEEEKILKSSKPEFRAFILEVNNNPAMASNGKLMSMKYRNHLIQFAKNTLLLGLGESNISDLNFEYLW
jgi:hypothetical protein